MDVDGPAFLSANGQEEHHPVPRGFSPAAVSRPPRFHPSARRTCATDPASKKRVDPAGQKPRGFTTARRVPQTTQPRKSVSTCIDKVVAVRGRHPRPVAPQLNSCVNAFLPPQVRLTGIYGRHASPGWKVLLHVETRNTTATARTNTPDNRTAAGEQRRARAGTLYSPREVWAAEHWIPFEPLRLVGFKIQDKDIMSRVQLALFIRDQINAVIYLRRALRFFLRASFRFGEHRAHRNATTHVPLIPYVGPLRKPRGTRVQNNSRGAAAVEENISSTKSATKSLSCCTQRSCLRACVNELVLKCRV